MNSVKKGVLALAAIGGLAIFSASVGSAMPVNKATGIETSSTDVQQAGWRWRHRGWHPGWRRGWHRGWHRRRW